VLGNYGRRDVDKLDNMQDGFMHYQLVGLRQATQTHLSATRGGVLHALQASYPAFSTSTR
jgi:hypothetical protein